MNTSLMPVARQRYFDSNGRPLSGGLVYTYATGTTTPKATFSDSAGTTPLPNPIPLDVNGEALIFWSGAYRVNVTSAIGVQIAGYPVDNYVSANVAVEQLEEELQQSIGQLSTNLVSPGGSNLVGFIQSGTGAIARKVQDELRERAINIKQFGAVGDWNGTTGTDNSDAFDRAVAFAIITGRSIFVPTGSYRITRTIVMNTGVYTRGIIMFGEGLNSSIIQTGAGLDAIHFSTTQFLQNSGLRDLSITSAVNAGHCINFVYGCTTCFVSNVEMAALNPVKSCVYGDYTSFGAGIFDTKFSGGSWYQNPASTVGGFVIRAKGTIFNENVFENLRCYQSNTVQFFDIETVVDPDIWLINNSMKNINFEICKGGGIKFSSFKNCKFENITFWDAGGNYVNNLIDMVAGTGYESAANTFINVTRNGDALSPSVRDIRIVSGQDTVMVNCYTAIGDGPSYDFSNKRVTVIGRMFNIENRNNATIILPELSSIPSVTADEVRGGSLIVGGRGIPDNTTISYSGGFVQVTPLLASSGIILTSTTGASTQSKLIFSPDGFYPLTDNFVSLGAAGQRFTQLHAASGTINTSDENSKDIRLEGIDPAVLRAWAKVEFYQYKFRDAIELKGDGARWHFGVVAQRVKAAFESEGLDAFAYGVLCYDEWPDAPAVMDDGAPARFDADGNEIQPARAPSEIKPAQQAGARYGIRYDEALILECAYLRSKIS